MVLDPVVATGCILWAMTINQEQQGGRILCAHLVGPYADEVTNLFGVAIRHELNRRRSDQRCFAYPTGASDIAYMP